MDIQPSAAPTPDASVVNPTAGANGVNPVQATQQIIDTSALIAQYESRVRILMSEKDKALDERNKVIGQLTTLQQQHTSFQEQTQGSLSAAANSAQQSIDRANQIERELAQARAANVKLTALMQRPHLAPYASLIPENEDASKVTAILDQLEQVRNHDMEQFRVAQSPTQPTNANQQQQQPNSTAQLLQNLYGNRPNMNPMFMQTPIIPSSSPAQMNPAATTDVTSAIQQIYAEAKKTGTNEAFEDATRRAALLANSLSGR